MTLRPLFFALGVAASSVSMTALADTKDDIYAKAGTIRNEVFSSSTSQANLDRANADLTSALSLIRGGGGGGGGGEIFCKRVRDSEFYAPARLDDGTWLQDNGTSLDQCRRQVASAAYGLYCSRLRETDYYAPRLVADLTWRGENGTDYSTCERQLFGARSSIFCQRIRDTDYYAPARIATGEWLQDNGTSLETCLQGIGSQAPVEGLIREPKVPSEAFPSVH